MPTLTLKGSVDVVLSGGKIVSKNGKRFLADVRGGDVELTSADGGSMVITNFSGNSYSYNNFVSCSNGVSMVNGDIYINGSDFNKKVVVNGVDIGDVIREEIRLRKTGKSLLSRDVQPISEPKDDGSVTSLDYSGKFTKIVISGSGNVYVGDVASLSSDMVMVITGSGNIAFQEDDIRLRNISVQISGSGAVRGCGNIINQANLTVTGSGSISKFHCTDSCIGQVTGSGSISVSAENTCNTDRTVTGSGTVSIKKSRSLF